jgi:hypothetical protein
MISSIGVPFNEWSGFDAVNDGLLQNEGHGWILLISSLLREVGTESPCFLNGPVGHRDSSLFVFWTLLGLARRLQENSMVWYYTCFQTRVYWDFDRLWDINSCPTSMSPAPV